MAMRPNWTKNELIAYVLLYASSINLDEDNHERNVIISKVDMETFQDIHDEFDADNDYQSIQKIKYALNIHNYSSDDLTLLFADVKALFFADGEFDAVEQYMFTYLKRILT